MNREEKRLYWRKIKNDKRAGICPLCKNRTLFYTVGTLKPYEGTKTEFKKEDFEVAIKCEVCGQIVLEDEELCKLIPPNAYLPLPLDIFKIALNKNKETNIEESNTDN